MKPRIAFVALLVLCLAPSGLAKSTSQEKVTGQVTYKAVPVRDGRLRVVLNDLPAGKSWALGVRVDSQTQPHVKAFSVVLEDAGSRPYPKEITAIDGHLDELQGSVLHLRRLSQLPGSLCVFLSVPSGTVISVVSESRTFFEGAITEGIQMRNGLLQRRVPKEVGDVLLGLIRNQPEPEIMKLKGGEYLASPEALRSRVKKFALPEPSDVHGLVSLRVEIDASGGVSKVVPLRGDHRLAAAAEEAVRKWTFAPFEVAGLRVPVLASASFSFAHGRVSSTIMNETLTH